jgi:hypothetical protein
VKVKAEMDEATREAFEAAMAARRKPTLGPIDSEAGLFLAGVKHGRKLRYEKDVPEAIDRADLLILQAKLARLLAAARPYAYGDEAVRLAVEAAEGGDGGTG